MTTARRAPRALLLEASRGAIPWGLSEDDWAPVLTLAGRHGVAPWLHAHITAPGCTPGVPEPVRSRLRRSRLAWGARNGRTLAALGEVLVALRRAGVETIVLKGAHLAETIYDDVSLRPMADVDLLVREPDLERAAGVLRGCGYSQPALPRGRERHLTAVRENMEVDPFVRPGGPVVDLHYGLLAASRSDAIDVDGAWDRADEARIGGAEARVLCPEDLLLHLCVHASTNHGFAVTLLHVLDVALVGRRLGCRIDWERLRARALSSGTARAIALTSALAGRLLGETLPPAAWPEVAAPFDVLAMSESLLFDETAPLTGSAHLPLLWEAGGPIGAARLAMRRTFPSRSELAFMHGLPASDIRVPLLYLDRVGRLLARYGLPLAKALTGQDAATRALVVDRSRARLVAWVAGA